MLQWGIYAEPIFSRQGGFPKEIFEIVERKSAEQNYPTSRMPDFTDEEKEFVRGTYDFFGVNHYTASFVSATEYKREHPIPSLYADIDVGSYVPPDWDKSASSWLTVSIRDSSGMRYSLTYVSNRCH